MAERDTLLSTLPPDVVDDAEKLYDDLGGIPDPRDIVGELHKRGLLDAGQLKDAVMSLEASLQIRHFQQKPPKGDQVHAILGQLGAGAMGEVLIAKDPGLNRIVAVKRLHKEAAKRRSMLRRFYTEAQVTAQLDHPSIVPIHGIVDIGDETLAYAMKLVRGRTLEDYFEETQGMWAVGKIDETHNLTARLERFLHVCDAMAYAHDRGILHRDLKPENIMVGAFGEVMIMDWGIAKVLANSEIEEVEDTSLPMPKGAKGTKVGTVMGTPRYMSPEQANGETDTMNDASDQYALGLILQELISLNPAVKDNLQLEEALAWAREAKRLPIKHFHRKGTIPRELAATIDKATQKNPKNRYKSVTAMAEDIRRYMRDEAPMAKPDNIFQKLQRFIARHRTGVILIILMLMFSVVIVAGIGLLGGLGAVEYKRHQAQLHEEQLTAILQYVVYKGQGVDMELKRIETLAAGVAAAAQQSLAAPAIKQSWDPTKQAPPGRSKSKRYGGEVSITHPEIGIASGETLARSRNAVNQLAGLGDRMGGAMSASHPKGQRPLSNRHKQIADIGVPILWMRVATAGGVQAAMPGTRSLTEDMKDPRNATWYKASKKRGKAYWSNPDGKTRGLGLALTCSVPWLDDDGKVAGVVAVDVALEHIAKKMKAPEAATAILVDKEGRIIARHGDSTSGKKWEQEPFPRKDVWEAIQASPLQGFYEKKGTLAMWTPIRALGATYVVMGDATELLATKDRREEERGE